MRVIILAILLAGCITPAGQEPSPAATADATTQQTRDAPRNHDSPGDGSSIVNPTQSGPVGVQPPPSSEPGKAAPRLSYASSQLPRVYAPQFITYNGEPWLCTGNGVYRHAGTTYDRAYDGWGLEGNPSEPDCETSPDGALYMLEVKTPEVWLSVLREGSWTMTSQAPLLDSVPPRIAYGAGSVASRDGGVLYMVQYASAGAIGVLASEDDGASWVPLTVAPVVPEMEPVEIKLPGEIVVTSGALYVSFHAVSLDAAREYDVVMATSDALTWRTHVLSSSTVMELGVNVFTRTTVDLIQWGSGVLAAAVTNLPAESRVELVAIMPDGQTYTKPVATGQRVHMPSVARTSSGLVVAWYEAPPSASYYEPAEWGLRVQVLEVGDPAALPDALIETVYERERLRMGVWNGFLVGGYVQPGYVGVADGRLLVVEQVVPAGATDWEDLTSWLTVTAPLWTLSTT